MFYILLIKYCKIICNQTNQIMADHINRADWRWIIFMVFSLSTASCILNIPKVFVWMLLIVFIAQNMNEFKMYFSLKFCTWITSQLDVCLTASVCTVWFKGINVALAETKGVPLSASKKVVAETPVDEFDAKDLRSMLHLKVDHTSRPLWVVSIAW